MAILLNLLLWDGGSTPPSFPSQNKFVFHPFHAYKHKIKIIKIPLPYQILYFIYQNNTIVFYFYKLQRNDIFKNKLIVEYTWKEKKITPSVPKYNNF